MIEEMEQLFCLEKLNRLELEGKCLKGGKGNIHKIPKVQIKWVICSSSNADI